MSQVLLHLRKRDYLDFSHRTSIIPAVRELSKLADERSPLIEQRSQLVEQQSHLNEQQFEAQRVIQEQQLMLSECIKKLRGRAPSPRFR